MIHLSHVCMTTGKIIALTIWNFVGKVMSLLLNMLSRLVSFLTRSKCLLISGPQSPSTAILELKKIKSATVSTFSSSICREVLESNVVLIFSSVSLSFPSKDCE